VATLRTLNIVSSADDAFMCFVGISEQRVIVPIYNINGLDFINENERVFCAIRNLYLNIIQDKFMQSPTSHLGGPCSIRTLCEDCGGERGKDTGFPPITSVFSCQDHPQILHTHLQLHVALIRTTKRVKPGHLKNSSALFRKGGTLDSEVF
jgi:hypothetical protein